MQQNIYLLGIESSCDETSAAITCNDKILANIIANQTVHEQYGGVVPELASRAHQQNIVPVVSQALRRANIEINQLSGVAYTRGPGLLGSLIVGGCFAKSFAMALHLPLIEVNHMQAHVLAHFIRNNPQKKIPSFPFLCLTVSGGHTQIVRVDDYLSMHILGQTLDDAAGEAFDKAAKILGLPYPGGPLIDRYAQTGNANRFRFPHPVVPDYNFSFSGLKTSFLNFIKKNFHDNKQFVELNKEDICASIQKTIVMILIEKLLAVSEATGIKEIAIAGGVSANSGLRKTLMQMADEHHWNLFIPEFEYCTDNAAMIAIAGYYKFLNNNFSTHSEPPLARYSL